MNIKQIGIILSFLLVTAMSAMFVQAGHRGDRGDRDNGDRGGRDRDQDDNNNDRNRDDNDNDNDNNNNDGDGDGDGDNDNDGEQQTEPTNLEEAIAFARQDIDNIMNGNRAAEFLRLSFHDCVGGCDGCVDLGNPDNFGLDDPIENLENIVNAYEEFLTRADVWVLAAMVAVEGQQDNGDVVEFDMQFIGRPNCFDNDPTGGPERSIPSSHATTHELLEFFSNTFGFTDRDTVAIMGAHTLGEANLQNSGFDGNNGWVRNEDEFDNQFYTTLLDNNQVDPDFEQELQDNSNRPDFPDQFLWRLGTTRFMLNIDMALAVDFTGHIDPTSGEVSCDLPPAVINACPMSSLLGIANEYADSNTNWLLDFREAFYKMTNTGCGNDFCTAL